MNDQYTNVEQVNDQSVESATGPADEGQELEQRPAEEYNNVQESRAETNAGDAQVEPVAETVAQQDVEEFDKAKAAVEKKAAKKPPRPKAKPKAEEKQDETTDNKEKAVVTTKAPPKPKKIGTGKGNKAKAAPKATAKKAEPGENGKAPAQKKGGLRQPQVRILQAISKAGRGLTRVEIAKAADLDPAMGHYLGASRPENYEEYSKKYGFPSLLSLGYLRAEEHDFDGKMKIIHVLTAAGRKALEKALKEDK